MKHRIHIILLDLMEKHNLHTPELFLKQDRHQLLDLVNIDALNQTAWHDIVGLTISRAKDIGWCGTLTSSSGARIGTPEQSRPSFEQAERDIALVAAALRFGMADKPGKQDSAVGVDFLLDGELFTLEWFDIRAETERAIAWARTTHPEAAGDDARIEEIVEAWCWETLESVAERIQDPYLCDHEERALYARLVTIISILAGRGIYSYDCRTGRYNGRGSSGALDQPGLVPSPN
jgi:hypothetical protein